MVRFRAGDRRRAGQDRPRRPLPEGLQITATWSVPDPFGGMTTALLRRARAFVTEAGTPVQIVTFDAALDIREVRARLTDAGHLVDGVQIRNVWDELQQLDDEEIGSLRARGPGERRTGTWGTAVAAADRPVSRHEDEDGVTTTLRADGSVLVRDLPGEGSARRLLLHTRSGEVVSSWKGAWDLYRSWLDAIVGQETAYVTVDSKAMVRFFATYRRPTVHTLHLVHGSHLRPDAPHAHGELNPTRKAMVEKADRFDAIVFLTEQQKTDVETRIGPQPNLYVIPNSTDLAVRAADELRDHRRGVVLASLVGRKRVDHAIRAVAAAGEQLGNPLRLDVYGDGGQRAKLEALVSRLPADAATVTLHGHRRGAAEEFAHASFMLLTSTAEGLPLVFVEAMARGCIPVAYDIRYGPQDIIEDGVNGFLVPAEDQAALTAAVVRLVSASPAELEPMRAAAVVRASRYSDGAVVAQWGEVMSEISGRRDGLDRAGRAGASRAQGLVTRLLAARGR